MERVRVWAVGPIWERRWRLRLYTGVERFYGVSYVFCNFN